MFKTFSATPSDIQHDWYVVDAEGMVLGRLATEIARIIRGKHKPMFTPHMDTGDGVIVINASKVRVTGRKAPSSGIRNNDIGLLQGASRPTGASAADLGVRPTNKADRS